MRPIRVVDAFTDRPFAGNPAAVMLLDAWEGDPVLQTVAAQMNLSETAFLVARGPGRWHLRWFTPRREVPFCGHATLASAHVLIAHEGAGDPVVFETRIGEIAVTRVDAGYRLDLPRLDPEPAALPDALAATLPTPPRAVFRNFENLFLVFEAAETGRAFRPDLGAISALDEGGLAITAPGEDRGVDFVSRYFAPRAGIDEDPVTGSTHATLAPFWAAETGRARLSARQLSARGGTLDCHVTEARVGVAGMAATVLEGRIAWPG